MRTLNLLEEFPTSRARVIKASPDGAHIGSGVVGGVRRDYLFIHPPSSVTFTLPGNALRFSASLSIHPDVWKHDNVGSVEFRVLSDGRPVFRFVVSKPQGEGKWQPIAIELPSNDQDERELTLTTAVADDGGFQWAIWGEPVVILFPPVGVGGGDVQPLDRRPSGWNPTSDRGSSPYPMLLPRETRIVFLAGNMKSGTTWLMKLLDAHPEIVCKGEMHPLEIFDTHRPESLPAPTLESVASGASMLREWYMAENNAWNVPFRGEGGHAHSVQDVTRDFVRFFFEWTLARYCRAKSLQIPRAFVDKSPAHTALIMRKIHHYFGIYNPHVIHLVRDPRDVTVARWLRYRRHQLAGDMGSGRPFRDEQDQREAERLLADPEGYVSSGGNFFSDRALLKDFFKEWVDVNESLAIEGPPMCGARYRRVQYEELKQDLPAALRGVFESLGVDASADVIADVITRCDIRNENAAPVSGEFRKGLVGEWTKFFSESDLALFDDRVRPVSEAFGYT